MEKPCLAEVKAILKSLVLTSTGKMTIDQLNRDYRNVEGEFIPFRRLGYSNIEKFFHSIPDTLKVYGSGPTAMVRFVANEKSHHIHDMIMKQKKPQTKVKCRSRTKNNTLQSTNNKVNNNQQPMRVAGHQLSPYQSTNRHHTIRTVKLWDSPPLVDNSKKIAVNNHPYYDLKGTILKSNTTQLQKTVQKTNLIQKCDEHVENISNLLENNCFITHMTSTSPISKSVKYSPETKNSQQSMKERINVSKTLNSKTDANNLINNIKVPKVEQKSQPEKLYENVKNLIISPQQIEAKNSIRDCSPNNSLKEVEEKQSSQSNNVMNSKLSEGFMKLFDINVEKEKQVDEAVPSFAAKYNVFCLDFPEHTVPFGSKIAPCKIPDDISVGSLIKIFVSEIHSPFKFWFHMHKEDHELDSLMFQIERYYTNLYVDDLRIPLTSLMPGQVCAACYNGLWHRAEIVAPPVNDTIKVSFIDYGTVFEVKIEEIKFLVSYFAQLPVQALRGCLSHVKPRYLHWSHEATLHFLNLTSDVMLYAKITEIDTENQILYMILCNTNGDEVVQVNKSLVEQRYAWYNEEWKSEKIEKNNGNRLRHPREDFPTFPMIESGEYPNFNELVNLKQRGIDYEAIYDLIIFNQSSILNKQENAPECIRKLPYFLTTTNPFRSDIMLELYATTSKTV